MKPTTNKRSSWVTIVVHRKKSLRTTALRSIDHLYYLNQVRTVARRSSIWGLWCLCRGGL